MKRLFKILLLTSCLCAVALFAACGGPGKPDGSDAGGDKPGSGMTAVTDKAVALEMLGKALAKTAGLTAGTATVTVAVDADEIMAMIEETADEEVGDLLANLPFALTGDFAINANIKFNGGNVSAGLSVNYTVAGGSSTMTTTTSLADIYSDGDGLYLDISAAAFTFISAAFAQLAPELTLAPKLQITDLDYFTDGEESGTDVDILDGLDLFDGLNGGAWAFNGKVENEQHVFTFTKGEETQVYKIDKDGYLVFISEKDGTSETAIFVNPSTPTVTLPADLSQYEELSLLDIIVLFPMPGMPVPG